MNTNKEQSLRDKYFANEIFKIGDIVEDTQTKEQMKVIDRGSNYVTVSTQSGFIKKWLNEVTEPTVEEIIPESKIPDFSITSEGQIKFFGFETKNLDNDISEFILEQFAEFSDLYSKHQMVKCLDLAIQENNIDRAYTLITRVSEFYSKNKIEEPFIVEVVKSEIERKRIVDIIAAIADIKPGKSQYQTIADAISALKAKYKQRSQWEIIFPFFKIAQDTGLTGLVGKLPFNITEDYNDDIILMTLEENFDLLLDDLDMDDITEAFIDEESADDLLTEVLSIETRNKMSRKLKQKEPIIIVKRERALSKGATSAVLMQRARKLAETIIKRRIFHKPAEDLTRQEKERFESGASRRRALIARLATRLVPKVRELQTKRLHHTNAPAAHNHDIATASISQQSGAS